MVTVDIPAGAVEVEAVGRQRALAHGIAVPAEVAATGSTDPVDLREFTGVLRKGVVGEEAVEGPTGYAGCSSSLVTPPVSDSSEVATVASKTPGSIVEAPSPSA